MSTVNKENLQKTFDYWEKRNKKNIKFAKTCPTMYEYLKENVSYYES
jgi:hypothetical protein